MNRRILAGCLVIFALASGLPSAQTPTMAVEDVRPGMVGVGRTVFSGSTLEDFKVHVLGVMRNVVGPRRDLILARLEGGPLARTGVIAGMSGSPVYIEGKLVGAVSYSLGQFSTEPIAGITPIAEMTDATAMSGAARGTRPVALSWPLDARELFETWSRDLGRVRPFAEAPGDALIVPAGTGDIAAGMGAMLRPIAVPLTTGGFAAGVLDPISPALMSGGFLPVAGAGQPAPAAAAAPKRRLVPGDAVGVPLMTGDFLLGATGTVTHVDGDRVYAFGHPLYNLGPTQFPMTTADVQVILPSLLASAKLASFGDTIGTLQQDRATAIAGTLGPGPALIPVSITLNSDRQAPRSFQFGVVRDTTFTPLLTYLAVANVLTSYERAAGPASYTVRGIAGLRSHDDIAFEDIFTGDQAVGGAAAYVAGPLTLLFKNTSDSVDLERVTLTIDASEQARTARIERVWLDTTRPRAGAPATVHVSLRTLQGQELVKQVPITLPANVTGSLQLLVSDAQRLGAEDRRDFRGADMQRASQLVRTFNRSRRNNRLYVRLSSTDQGAIVNGEPMAALPPSVLAVLEADRNSGTFSPLRSAPRGEWEVPVELAVSGSRLLTLTLDQP
jgi:hypothetical protein